MHVAVLGMGLLGSGFAENLAAKGQKVHVWNRTAKKCAQAVEAGAIQCDSPAEAVRGASRVHLILSEDPAVDAVIEAMRPGLAPSTPIIDHSTNHPDKVRARAKTLAADGLTYLSAPVFMAPANSRSATGLMLVSGPQDTIDSVLPALETMTGTVKNVGEEIGQAAAIKLGGNGLIMLLTAGMGDLMTLLQHHNVPPDIFLETLTDGFGAKMAAGMGKRVLRAGTRPATFEMTMARKDVRLMMESAPSVQALQLLPAIANAMDTAIAEGHGSEDYALFAKPRS